MPAEPDVRDSSPTSSLFSSVCQETSQRSPVSDMIIYLLQGCFSHVYLMTRELSIRFNINLQRSVISHMN